MRSFFRLLKRRRDYKNSLIIFSSLLSLGLLWWSISLFFSPNFLPSPVLVSVEIWKIIVTGEFFTNMLNTTLRIVFGFSLAMMLSCLLGVLMGMNKLIAKFFEAEILVGLTIPALAWGVIAILLFGLNDIAAIFAIMVLISPMITLNVFQGMKSLDRDLIAMGKVFEATKYQMIKQIVFPQLLPYLFAATRYGLALAWKTVVIVEMLGLSNGIGYKIAFSFGMFSMKGVLAWTLLFTMIMLIIEYAIIGVLEKRLMKWRPKISF